MWGGSWKWGTEEQGCGFYGFSWGARILSGWFFYKHATLHKICLHFKCAAALSDSVCVNMWGRRLQVYVFSISLYIQVRVNALHFCIRQVFLTCAIWLKWDWKKHQQKYTQVAIILCPQYLCCAISKLSLSGATTTPFNSHRDAVLSGWFLFLLFQELYWVWVSVLVLSFFHEQYMLGLGGGGSQYVIVLAIKQPSQLIRFKMVIAVKYCKKKIPKDYYKKFANLFKDDNSIKSLNQF